MYRAALLLACVVLLVPACKGGGNSSPAPSPTTSSVSVTMNPSTIRISQNVQASGMAQLSNGQSQAVTTGWMSDVPTVARVTDAGLVTGVSTGRANIFVISGGRQGQVPVRVVPDYLGHWEGGLLVTECTESGIVRDLDFCDDFPVGIVTEFEVDFSQTGEMLNARPSYGPDFTFPSVDATIRDDGSTEFKTTYIESGLSVAATWKVNSPSSGNLVGTVDEVWSLIGLDGEGILRQTIVMPTKTGTTVGIRSVGGSVKSRVITLIQQP